MSSPHSEKEMLEQVSDFLLSGDSFPTHDDPLHPTKELNRTMVEYAYVALGENDPDPRKIAKMLPEMTPQQVQDLLQEHSACRDSNDVKGIEILPEPEPGKEKTLKRKGIWSAEEKRLFLSGLLEYDSGNWKNISRHIGTRLTEQVRSYARRAGYRRRRIPDIQSLPPETNRPIANPGHLPFLRTDYDPMIEPMDWDSNLPPPIWRDLPSSSPEPGLHDIYDNFGGSVYHASWNLGGEMGANPSSRNSDQVWNSTNTLSSDSYGCLPGLSAYGNNINPGQ